MAELFQTFIELITVFLRLVVEVLALGLTWSFLLFWFAWWLWAVNWKKAWHVLGEGGWAPAALICLMAAGVWSQLRPGELPIMPGMVLANFWWQLGAVGLIAGSALFCGWLQGYFGWAPAEMDLEPPVHAAEASHGHH